MNTVIDESKIKPLTPPIHCLFYTKNTKKGPEEERGDETWDPQSLTDTNPLKHVWIYPRTDSLNLLETSLIILSLLS